MDAIDLNIARIRAALIRRAQRLQIYGGLPEPVEPIPSNRHVTRLEPGDYPIPAQADDVLNGSLRTDLSAWAKIMRRLGI